LENGNITAEGVGGTEGMWRGGENGLWEGGGYIGPIALIDI